MMQTTMTDSLSFEQLEAIRRLDTCIVANAIETFHVRMRNEGFANASIRCVASWSPNMLGYAVTARVCTSSPPISNRPYPERTDWWSYVLSMPAPRVLVLQDVDEKPGFGALVGEVQGNISLALGCVGVVTNGAVRGIGQAPGLHLFAGNLTVARAYAHIVEFGTPVEIGGLPVAPGDLLHGDCHGVHSIPIEMAAEIPDAVERVLEKERKVIGLCRSPEFSMEKLRAAVEQLYS
jgi:regulator of RNase E activity RraA